MIIQIMPAPSNLYAVYEVMDGELEYYERVLFIALLDDGSTEMHSVGVDGYIDEVSTASNFLRVEYINEK